jgi:hypothetical protein
MPEAAERGSVRSREAAGRFDRLSGESIPSQKTFYFNPIFVLTSV